MEAQEERLKTLQKPESVISVQNMLLDCQSLQDEAESSEGSWQKLQEVIGRLKVYCPSVAEIIEEKCQDIHIRWTQVNQDIADQLRKAQSLLQLWKVHTSAHTEAVARLEQQEVKYRQPANINMSGDNLEEILTSALRDIKVGAKPRRKTKGQDRAMTQGLDRPQGQRIGSGQELQHDVQKTKEAFLQNSTLLDRLPQPTESDTHFVLSQFKDFGDRLESLKGLIMHEEENLDKLHQQEKEGNPESFLNHVLALTAQSPDVEHLNEISLKLPLSDIAVKTLQNINWRWIQAMATALEHCRSEQSISAILFQLSELQEIGLNKKFLYCCEKWVQLLEKTEEIIKENIADSLPALLEQQKTYEDSLTICFSPRLGFVSKFAKLKNQWQSAARGIRQRKREVDGLVRQWQYFTTSKEDLHRFLADASHVLSAVKSQDCYNLCQTRSLIHELKELDKSLGNWTQNFKELHTMKTYLAQQHLVEDVMVLKEQIRAFAQTMGGPLLKKLCVWLVQMENKVLQAADISIEEMIEKLQKDCMEEINLFSESKLQLKQMGDQLIKASSKTRAAEIDDKLNEINDHWQHLFDVIGSR
ncbi:Nesprin-2 [Pteropus alecto]|uniref:Nesprin-2 n=1 Tax=Pteropus alecto TaxID=9402 RepID=L5JYT8_PTEAL|nr:Nesprin-2 [Pteropus alecto]